MTHSSLWGGVQTLVLTTQDLIYPGRSSNIEVNSADSAVMEIVKSNMIDMVPFQLLYYGNIIEDKNRSIEGLNKSLKKKQNVIKYGAAGSCVLILLCLLLK